MKTLEELILEFDRKTTIQQQEHLKKLVGVDVKVIGEIPNIDAEHINLETERRNPASIPLNLPWFVSIYISHKDRKLGNQLLEYSGGDGVKLVMRLEEAGFAEHHANYTFNLLSILKLNSYDERMLKVKTVREAAERKVAEQNKAFCFVATAVYGSYEHPSVLILRRFRDERLRSHAAGRIFIAFYYRFGPRLARVVVAHSRLRSVLRGVLNQFVHLMK